MAKAKIKLPTGVQIEGAYEEVKELLKLYLSNSNKTEENTGLSSIKAKKRTKAKGASWKNGPAELIRELIHDEYFKGQKRSLSDIQKKLEERGHIYAQQSLSTPLIRLVKSKELRRLDEKKGWMYVV